MKHHTFARNDVLPSWWANAIQEALDGLIENFRIRLANSTTVEVPAGADDDKAVITIDGKWRWVSATVQRAHPGGGSGTYRLWVTAANNVIVSTPDPHTDNTNYAFALAITATGQVPNTIPGSVDIWREVATLEWNGTAITAINPLLNLEASQADLDTHEALTSTAHGGIVVTGDARIPTQAENDALQGTTGTVGGSNRYVTDQDTRNTNARAPTAHASGHGSGQADPLANIAKTQLGVTATESMFSSGDLKVSAVSAPQTGWLLCDGSPVSRATYAALYAALGSGASTWGQGDGVNTFNVPDFRGRALVMKGTHTEVDALGDSDGLAVGSRKIKHKHGKGTLAISGGSHGHALKGRDGSAVFDNQDLPKRVGGNFTQSGDMAISSGGAQAAIDSNTHTHPSGEISGELGDTGGPLDGPSFAVLNVFIKT